MMAEARGEQAGNELEVPRDETEMEGSTRTLYVMSSVDEHSGQEQPTT